MANPDVKTTQELKGEDWAGEMGERWLASLDRLETMLEPIGSALLDAAAYKPGENVLDIGSGGGRTTRLIADDVAPGGVAVGVDVAPMLVEEAEKRAIAEGIKNAHFVCADAGSEPLGQAPFDRMFSRFGSMFFTDPAAAFSSLRSALKPTARIDLAVWGPPRDNAWMMEMMGVVRQHIDIPPVDPRAPGPFAFGEREYLTEILNISGFSKPEFAAFEGQIAVGGPHSSPEEAVSFVQSSMGVGRVLEGQEEEIRDRALAGLLALFDRHHVGGKGIMMGCKAWFVSATA